MQLPPTAKAGDRCSAKLPSGKTIMFTAPPNAVPGMMIQVDVPADAAAAPTPAQRQAAAEAQALAQAAAAAEAQVAAAAAALKEAEAKKEEQGRRVDASLEGAKAEVAGQLSAHREALHALEGQVATMKERGNTAMRAGDRTAALGFYSEAIRIATDGGHERCRARDEG
mgnify:FL=1